MGFGLVIGLVAFFATYPAMLVVLVVIGVIVAACSTLIASSRSRSPIGGNAVSVNKTCNPCVSISLKKWKRERRQREQDLQSMRQHFAEEMEIRLQNEGYYLPPKKGGLHIV
jgi:hypothetical protein